MLTNTFKIILEYKDRETSEGCFGPPKGLYEIVIKRQIRKCWKLPSVSGFAGLKTVVA